MKITASKKPVTAGRREDIIKQRDEWESAYDQAKAKQNEESQQYRKAQDAVMAPIEQEIKEGMAKFDRLSTKVTVDTRWGGSVLGETIQVRIQVNEWEKFQDNVALAWDMDVHVDKDGNVIKETGSWSGLKATTTDQLESLRQTLSALEYLNSIDWATLLNKTLPNFEDYYKTQVPDRRDRPNFEQQLQDVDLEELVGTDKVVKVENWEGSGYRGKYAWVQLIRETPSGYTVRVRGDWGDNEVRIWLRRAIDQNFATQRMRKSSLKPVMPIETMDPATDEEMAARDEAGRQVLNSL